MDTRRQEIIDAIILRMQEIKLVNGFQTDLGQRVEDWPRRFDDDELPALAVCDLTEESERSDAETDIAAHRLPVQVRIFLRGENPARAFRQAIGDVQQAIKRDLTWHELATATYPRRSGFIITSEAMEIAGAVVEFDVEYVTSTFNPFKVELET